MDLVENWDCEANVVYVETIELDAHDALVANIDREAYNPVTDITLDDAQEDDTAHCDCEVYNELLAIDETDGIGAHDALIAHDEVP